MRPVWVYFFLKYIFCFMNTRLHSILEKFITRANLILLLGIQNILSICSVFSSPLPIPPKTSVGILTGISLLMVFFLWFLRKKRKVIISQHILAIDVCIYGYVVISAVSLVCSQYIFDLTNFRLLLIAVVQYVTIRCVDFSEGEKMRSIHLLGIATVVVAGMSLFQVIFQEQAAILARNFLFGDAAYSIAYDLQRGRGVQWGNIILTFPFFVYSVLVFKKRKSLLLTAYTWLGIFLIPLSFILSNFRGLTLCFFIGIFAIGYYLYTQRIVLIKKMLPVFFAVCAATSVGIVLASAVFQYSLIDRFLFKEEDRDIKSTMGRIDLYEQAISTFFASPFIGIGTGNYRYNVDRIRVVSYYNIIDGETGVKENEKASVSSHNDVLTILAETGLLGLIFYAGIFCITIKNVFFSIRRRATTPNYRPLLSFVFFISFVMLALSGIFENTPANNIVYIFFLYGASEAWFKK